MDIKILVATHKPYEFPKDSSIYIPIQLGCDEVEERFGYLCDNTGDNISYKHRFYSDLSSMYWGWKNLDCEYFGSCHYRRYFVSKNAKHIDDNKLFKYILSREELEQMLTKCSVIVAKKRNYFIETNEQQYCHAHNPKDLELTREVLKDLYPDYLNKFNEVMKRTWSHKFNTFIMDKPHADAFCKWMFDILFEIENRMDISDDRYDIYQSRILGYIAERLMDVWLEHDNIKFQEVKLAMLEKQNWPKKISNFLKRKFLKKYRPFS